MNKLNEFLQVIKFGKINTTARELMSIVSQKLKYMKGGFKTHVFKTANCQLKFGFRLARYRSSNILYTITWITKIIGISAISFGLSHLSFQLMKRSKEPSNLKVNENLMFVVNTSNIEQQTLLN